MLHSSADAKAAQNLADWIDWVAAPQTQAELDGVRRSVVRGSPYGSETWQRRTAHRLGLDATLRPRGRPKKKPAKGAEK